MSLYQPSLATWFSNPRKAAASKAVPKTPALNPINPSLMPAPTVPPASPSLLFFDPAVISESGPARRQELVDLGASKRASGLEDDDLQSIDTDRQAAGSEVGADANTVYTHAAPKATTSASVTTLSNGPYSTQPLMFPSQALAASIGSKLHVFFTRYFRGDRQGGSPLQPPILTWLLEAANETWTTEESMYVEPLPALRYMAEAKIHHLLEKKGQIAERHFFFERHASLLKAIKRTYEVKAGATRHMSKDESAGLLFLLNHALVLGPTYTRNGLNFLKAIPLHAGERQRPKKEKEKEQEKNKKEEREETRPSGRLKIGGRGGRGRGAARSRADKRILIQLDSESDDEEKEDSEGESDEGSPPPSVRDTSDSELSIRTTLMFVDCFSLAAQHNFWPETWDYNVNDANAYAACQRSLNPKNRNKRLRSEFAFVGAFKGDSRKKVDRYFDLDEWIPSFKSKTSASRPQPVARNALKDILGNVVARRVLVNSIKENDGADTAEGDTNQFERLWTEQGVNPAYAALKMMDIALYRRLRLLADILENPAVEADPSSMHWRYIYAQTVFKDAKKRDAVPSEKEVMDLRRHYSQTYKAAMYLDMSVEELKTVTLLFYTLLQLVPFPSNARDANDGTSNFPHSAPQYRGFCFLFEQNEVSSSSSSSSFSQGRHFNPRLVASIVHLVLRKPLMDLYVMLSAFGLKYALVKDTWPTLSDAEKADICNLITPESRQKIKQNWIYYQTCCFLTTILLLSYPDDKVLGFLSIPPQFARDWHTFTLSYFYSFCFEDRDTAPLSGDALASLKHELCHDSVRLNGLHGAAITLVSTLHDVVWAWSGFYFYWTRLGLATMLNDLMGVGASLKH